MKKLKEKKMQTLPFGQLFLLIIHYHTLTECTFQIKKNNYMVFFKYINYITNTRRTDVLFI